MATIGRRRFFVTGGTAAVATSVAMLGRNRQVVARGPWGKLVEDPEGILDLPAGFSYEILETRGDPMDDGYRVPGRPDGMACFAGPNATLVLMRNHENFVNDWANGPYMDGQDPPPEAYERTAMGGVTRVVVDAQSYARLSSNLVLTGTIRNCAGGPSPWGWLSCEETTAINVSYKGAAKVVRHGYVFLCPIDAASVQAARPIEGYGRFTHEAIAVDPSNNYAYLTEDRVDSCLYRFVPDDMAEPFVGDLQALVVVGVANYDTNSMSEGEVVDIAWVPIDDPDPDSDTVRREAQDKGAARFVRGEGIWFHEGMVYICSTSGGPAGAGQIFRLIDGNAATLELIAQSTDTSILANPDNITVAPWGDVFMAEDGGGDDYIRWVDGSGRVCDFARNALSGSEFAGVCFSPDGRAMFVNLQYDGLTLVITGPFPTDPGGGDGDLGPDESCDTAGTDTDTDESGDAGSGTETGSDDAALADCGTASCACSSQERGQPGATVVGILAASIGLKRLIGPRDGDDECAASARPRSHSSA